jgi:hypothetical protein
MLRRKLIGLLPTLPIASLKSGDNPHDKDVRSRWVPYSSQEIASFKAEIERNNGLAAECRASMKDVTDAGLLETWGSIVRLHEDSIERLQTKIDEKGYWKRYLA